jgi:hypothetical protein
MTIAKRRKEVFMSLRSISLALTAYAVCCAGGWAQQSAPPAQTVPPAQAAPPTGTPTTPRTNQNGLPTATPQSNQTPQNNQSMPPATGQADPSKSGSNGGQSTTANTSMDRDTTQKIQQSLMKRSDARQLRSQYEGEFAQRKSYLAWDRSVGRREEQHRAESRQSQSQGKQAPSIEMHSGQGPIKA